MLAKLHFFPAQSGHPSARLEFSDGRRIHLHSGLSPEKESETLLDVDIWANTVVVLGVGLGYQLDNVDFGPAKRVVLVDVYPALLRRCQERLSKRIDHVACVSTSQIHALQAALRSEPGATLQILRHPPSLQAYPDVYESIETAILSARTPANTSKSRPKKVLLMQGRYFLEQELSEALSHHTLTERFSFPYRDLAEGAPRESVFQKQIEKDRPDLIVTIGFKGFDREGRLFRMAERYGIPIAVWFLDDPRPAVIAFAKEMGTQIHAFVWDRAYMPWIQTRGFASVSYLPLAASDSIFYPDAPKGQRIPLSFVGSALDSDFVSKIKDRFLWDPEHQGLLDNMASQLLAGHIDALTAAEGDLPYSDEKNRVWFANAVVHTASHHKRVILCQSLLQEGLETFGDPSSWQKFLGQEARCHKSVDYYTELPDVYRRSDINFNITSCQMPSTVNQRLFDVPLAGGFLLTDPQEDATALFREGEEVIVYRSIEEAKELVRFFSKHPNQRDTISRAAAKKIRGEHLVVHRVETMLQSIF